MYNGPAQMIVYIYTFPNGKKYVGQTSNSIEHRSKNGEGYRTSPAVYNAIQKYGWDNITIETYTCSSKEEMNEMEQYYIRLYNTTNNQYGYNLTTGGEGTPLYDREQVCALWRQGLGISEIATYMGCIPNTISLILKSEGLYDTEEIARRKKRQLKLSSGEKLKQYYQSEEHQLQRKQNGLKGAKARSKAVIVFKDKECTQLVGIYESGRKCAKALKLDHSIPSYALTHNHYGSGYYFYFLDDKDPHDCTYDQISK